jgi:transcriptional regulator with XRE-family HTH domain
MDAPSLRTRRLLRKALKLLTPSLAEIADECDLPHNTVRAYQQGNRTPAPAVMKRLVVVLRRHGAQLAKLAEELEQASKQKPGR